MPKITLEDAIHKVLTGYMEKDLRGIEVRNALVRDILNTIATQSVSKSGATVMTREASAYNPNTDTIPIRPKSI